MLRGIVVYFWVDRFRRKLAYWEVSINLVFSICLFLNSVLFFNLLLLYYFIDRKRIDLLKLGF
jgi:hypothetical protein